ncbi:methylmalonyl Co-A mutase-associated GTPase MeaB [Chloroflexota bacterium]
MRTKLVKEMLEGKVLALAKLITMVEEDSAEAPEIMKLIYSHLGKAYRAGLTGPPGSGKSTLVDKLTAALRKESASVGLICVDPTSPFTGGALLGDRIRMQQHYLDEGVFLRSMATRGSLGGLPETIGGVIKLLDAFGKDFILVETVGVGQCEVDVMESVDTVIVVLIPGSGDAIQAMKAGLMETADILVVNKCDYPEAQNMVSNLQGILHSRSGDGWQTPIVMTEAIHNKGIDELIQRIKEHRQFLEANGGLTQRRQQQRRAEFMDRLQFKAIEELKRALKENDNLSSYLERIDRGEIDPYSAADEVFKAKGSPAK